MLRKGGVKGGSPELEGVVPVGEGGLAGVAERHGEEVGLVADALGAEERRFEVPGQHLQERMRIRHSNIVLRSIG